MKLEEIIKNLTAQYETKIKQVNQLGEALEKAKVELQQLIGAYQLAAQLKEEENKEARELAEKAKPIQEVIDPE
jgi:exonuclease VII small subunit